MPSSKSKTGASLGFSNHLIKLQSLSALQQSIETAAKQNGEPLDIKHPQLMTLVDGVGSPSLSMVTTCCALLTSAVSVHHKWVESRSLMAFFISQAATAQHYTTIVDAIGRILVGEMEEAGGGGEGDYQCPYSLRSNVHPFISVLNSRPESGLCVVEKAIKMFQRTHLSSMLKLVEPFMKYILLTPSPSSEMMMAGSYLHSQLLSLAKTFLTSEEECSSHSGRSRQCGTLIVELLLKLVPLQATKTDPQLLTVVSMVQGMVDLQVEVNVGKGLVDICLSLICELTSRGLPTVMLIESTVKLIAPQKKLAVHHCLAISYLLLQNLLNPSVVEALLRLLQVASESSLSPFLIFPFVQVLSQPISPLSLFGSRDQVSLNQKTASTLLKLCDSSQVNTSFETAVTSCSGQYSLLVSAAQDYAVIADNPDRVLSWLENLVKKVGTGREASGASDHLVVMVAAVILKYCSAGGNERIVEAALKALCSIAHADPTMSPSILPFFLYLTSVMSEPSCKLSLLYSIPNLATHKLASVSVSNAIITLGKTPSLLPVATRLIGKAWQLQDHLFPLVQEFLSRPLVSSTLTQTTIREVALARAAVIRDVCNTRAEQHGEAMLSLISVVLSSASHDPSPVAMVIEGLVSLCKAEVVDVATLWGVIDGGGGRLSQDTRPIVVGALCELLELAAELDTETRHLNKSFKATALKFLWKYALSQEKHSSSAAWKALRGFQLEDFLLDYLPSQFAAQLKQGQDHVSDEEGASVPTTIPLTGAQCVQLLQWIPVDSLSEYSDFLSGLLGVELEEIGRGVIYSALREAQMTSQCEKQLEATMETLQEMCTSNMTRDTTPARLISGTLMSVYGRSARGRGIQNARRQHLNEHLKNCLAKLEVLLKDSCPHTCLEGAQGWMGLSCLHLGRQWRMFMKTVCDAYYQIRLLDTCSVSVQDDPANPVLQEKLTEAHTWSRKQVLEKLENFAKVNPKDSSKVFVSLVGVASISVQQTNQTFEKTQQSHDQLLFELLDCVLFVFGEESRSSPSLTILQTLMKVMQPDLKTFVILSLPLLVDAILCVCWEGIPESVARKMVEVADRLHEEMLRNNNDWCIGLVLNEVLEMTLHVIPNMSSVVNKTVPHIDSASQTDGLTLLSVVSAFIPSFLLQANNIPLALKTLSLLQERLHSLDEPLITTPEAQLCSLHFASGMAAMFAAGQLSEDQGMVSVTVLAELATKAPHVCVFHLSLSVALFGLSAHGLRNASALSDTIAAKWLQESSTGDSEDEVLPLLVGLAGLLGFNPITSECSNSSRYGVVHTSFLKTLSPLVLTILQKFVAHPSDVVSSSALWLTLKVCESVTSVFSVTEKVPENYDYLPESGVLSCAYGLLESLSNSLSDVGTAVYLDAILNVFTKCEQFPPVNFNKLMIPFVKSETLQLKCIECLVHRKDTLGFKQFATCCCTHSVFITLQDDAQCLLLENLPVLLSSVSFIELSRFLQLVLGPLSAHLLSQSKWVQSLLTGLNKTLELDDLDHKCKHLMVISVKKLYRLLSQHWEKETSLYSVDRTTLQDLAMVLSFCGECTDLVELSSSNIFHSGVAAVIHCCWVAASVKRFTFMEGVVGWLLSNIESPGIMYQFCWMLYAVCECKSSQGPGVQTSQLVQTDLLHMLLTWTRTNTASPSQLKAVLLLAVSSVQVDNQLPWSRDVSERLPTLDEMFTPVVLSTTPKSSVVREKLCQCLLEWLHLNSDVDLYAKIVGLLSLMKSSPEYTKAPVWTFVAHIL